jgi:hypothetical protein
VVLNVPPNHWHPPAALQCPGPEVNDIDLLHHETSNLNFSLRSSKETVSSLETQQPELSTEISENASLE